VPILDGAVYKFKNSHGEFMISIPTSKSRTGEGKPSLQSEGIVGRPEAIDAEINTMHASKRNEHEREPRERVCRSWCRQTSLLPTIQEDRCYTAVAMAEQANIDTVSMWVITRFPRRALDAAYKREMRAIGSDYFEATTSARRRWVSRRYYDTLGVEYSPYYGGELNGSVIHRLVWHADILRLGLAKRKLSI
jgi:hypothetical protein